MKNLITYLKTLWSWVADSQSTDVSLDCRRSDLRRSPSGFNSKLMLKLVSVLVLILTIGVGNVWADTYALVTDASTLAEGDEIIIVNDNATPTKALGTTQNSNNRAAVNITVTNGKITPGADVQIITLGTATISSTTYWTLKVGKNAQSQDQYLYSASNSNNYLRTTTDLQNTGKWSISISSGTATIDAQANRPRMRFNSTLFSCYAANSGTGTLVRIYKKEAAAFTVTASSNNNSWGTVSVSGTTITATPADCYQVVSGTGGYTVVSGTYSSITHTGNSNTISVTPTANCSIQVVFEKQTVNTYVDEIQGNADIEDCGTHDAPTLEDEDVPGALETRCAQLHYHFVGWVTAANKANPTDDNIITPGTSMTADGATYYAVWARGNGGSLTVTQANCAAGASASGYSNKSWTATGTDGNSYSGIYRIYGNSTSASMQFNNSGIGMYTPQLPEAITSITLVKASGSDRNWTPRVSATTQQTSSSSSNGTDLTAKSVNGTVSWSVDASQNYRYLYLGVAGGASYLSSITVTWGTFSDYICTCCTELGTINGSFSLTQSNGVLTATLPSASKNANATSYRFTLYNNSDVEITHTDVASGGGDVSTTFSSPNVTAGNTYKVSVTPLVSPQGSFCSTTGTESDKASITMHYTVTLAVNNAEYGSISPTSTLYVASGTSISASTNTLSVGATNITATYTPQTAQYTYGFTNWTWSPSGSTITANTTATANFSRSTRTYNVTTTGITHATASPAIPATVAYGGSITTTITADANYSLPSAITVTGATLDSWNSSTGALSITDVTGDVSITITAVTAMKRIYMNTDGTSDGKWGKDSPKFFVHSWGSSDYDAELVAQPCASNVFYVDIPEANTNLLFTRQDPSKGSSIIYKGNDGNWSQSVDITISTNNYFTFNGNWDVSSSGKSGFNAGTYTPDMKTIYLSFCAAWLENNPLFALYDVTHSTWMSTFAEAGTGCYAGYYIAQVPSCAETVLIGRFKPGTPAPFGWSGENWWGQSVDFTIGSDTYDKITIEGWGTEGDAKDKGYGSLGNFALTQYTISFAGGGGTGSMSSLTNKDCGSDVTLPNVSFTKTGYDFDGWHADVDVKVGGATIPTGSTIANQATIQDIRSNVALTAQWVAKEYTITLDREGASTGSENVTMTYNSSSHTAITAPSKTGYNFGGWYSGDNGTGSQVMDASGVLQANVDGYTGAGGVWTRTTTPTTLYAKWNAKEYTINLDREGASTGAESVTATYDAGTLAGWSAPSKTGYTFGGYWSDDNGTGTLVISTTGVLQNSVTISAVAWTDGSGHWVKDGGVTVYAKWTAEQYDITYKDQGNVAYSGNATAGVPTGAPTTHTYGSATALVDGVKDGYRFDGWFTDPSCTVSAGSSIGATAMTADFTLYAKWTQVYTVTWSVNGETWSSGVVEGNTHVPGGSKVSALPTAPTKSDCDDAKVFVGWRATAIDGTSTSDPGGIFTTQAGSPAISANTNFYAVFADESGGDNTLVTNVSELTVGTQVYFYTETSDDPAFTAVMKAYESGNNVRAVSGSVSNNKLTPSDGACLYTIGTAVYSETTGYTFNDGTNYLYAASTSSNHLKSRAAIEDDGWAIFSISITDGVASISSIGNTSRGVLQFNKNNDTGDYTKALFACYASADPSKYSAVQLFKKNPLVYSNYVTTCASCDENATYTNTTPTVSEIECTDATLTMPEGLATLGGEGCNISDYGFVIGTSDNPAVGGDGVTKFQVGTSNPTLGNDFSYNATGLTKGTHYYVRAYATNLHGTAYSSTSTNFWTKNVSSISITTAPTKTNYIVGETFDATGMVVTATMASGATEDVTSDVTYSTDPLTSGTNQDFAIEYTLCETDKSVNQKINVYTLSVSEGTNPSYGSYTVDGAVITVSLEAQKTFSFATTNCSTRDNGDGTYTVINVTGNATVVINYRDAIQVKVYYKVDGTTITSLTQDVYESSQTTLPTASALSSAMAAQGMALPDELYPNFIGWSETEFGAQTEDPTIIEGTPIITASKSFYAVYSNVEKIRIDESDITSTSYPGSEQTLTKSSKDFKYHYVCKNSTYYLQFKKNSTQFGYIYNNTAISNIVKIEVGASGDNDFVPVYAGSAANTISGSKLTDEDISEYKYVYLFPSNTQYFIIKGDNSYTYKVNYVDIFYASSTVYYMTQFCTRYDIDGASTSGTAVIVNGNTGGTLTSSHNELCEGKNLTLSATVNTQYSFGEWKIVKTGAEPEVDLTADLLGANKTSLTPPAFSMPGYGITVSATISEKTATAWSWTYNSAAIPDPMILYVGEIKQLDVTYTPDASQLVADQKNYSVEKESSVAQVSKTANYYRMRGAAGVTVETNTAVTFSLNSLSQVVNVTVRPLPSATFEDNVHNAISTTVTATVTDGVVALTQKTPTHADVAAPVGGNDCETTHLHLVGWIDGDWEPFINYMNGGSRPSDSDITSATGYFYLPNADIDLSQKGGKTYYAVWGKADE